MRLLALAGLLAGCVDTTGGALVTFRAAAAGPEDAVAGGPLETETGLGYHVAVTQARLHIGAVYLNRSQPSAGAQETACVLPGIYNGQVRAGLDVDLLSPELQPFPGGGEGTADASTVAELWLVSGPVEAETDRAIILALTGTATKADVTIPFSATVTINSNRAATGSAVEQPGAHPICKQRVVTPIRVDLTPTQGGLLVVRVDPRPWLANLDFAELPAGGVIPDDNDDQQSKNLFNAMRASSDAYAITWQAAPAP